MFFGRREPQVLANWENWHEGRRGGWKSEMVGHGQVTCNERRLREARDQKQKAMSTSGLGLDRSGTLSVYLVHFDGAIESFLCFMLSAVIV